MTAPVSETGQAEVEWALLMAPPTAAELDVAIGRGTHFEAVRDLLVGRGLRVWTGASASGGSATRALVTPYPDGSEVYATWGTTHFGTESAWRQREDEVARSRRQLMAQALEALRNDPSPNTAVRVFTGDHAGIDAHKGARAVREAIVKAWWETRCVEGHTLDSARTLLRLMVDPVAWATYDALVDALLGAGDEALDADRQRRVGQTETGCVDTASRRYGVTATLARTVQSRLAAPPECRGRNGGV